MCFRLRVLGERLEGTYAQYVKLPAQNCFPVPTNYSYEEAAAFPLVFITLWRMLNTNAALKPGETILIIGIGGGGAGGAVPFAKKKGAPANAASRAEAQLGPPPRLGPGHASNQRTT